MAAMSMDDLLEFAGYLSLAHPTRKEVDDGDVEAKLVKSLGKPS